MEASLWWLIIVWLSNIWSPVSAGGVRWLIAPGNSTTHTSFIAKDLPLPLAAFHRFAEIFIHKKKFTCRSRWSEVKIAGLLNGMLNFSFCCCICCSCLYCLCVTCSSVIYCSVLCTVFSLNMFWTSVMCVNCLLCPIIVLLRRAKIQLQLNK
jgi:hypothetical protein